MTCHLEAIHESRKHSTWKSALKKARENVLYVEAFKRYLDNPVTLDNVLKVHKESVDASRSYDELKILRELSVFYLKRERGVNGNEKVTPTLAAEEVSIEVQSEDADGEQQEEVAVPESHQESYLSTLQAWYE
jgi:hypothetical protein